MADVRALIVGPHKHDVADLCSRDGERSRDACKAYGLCLLEEHGATLLHWDVSQACGFPNGLLRERSLA